MQGKIDKITDILRRDDGISGAMHYSEQISWVLFLKFLDDYEEELKLEAELDEKPRLFCKKNLVGGLGQHLKQAKESLM